MDEFKEFETENEERKKAGVLGKNGAGFIDAFLVILLQSAIFYFIPKLSNAIEFPNALSYMLFYTFLTFFMYRFITIFSLGKTVGMAALNIQFAKENETQLSFKEKLLSVLMIYTNTVDCYNIE
jgi:fructose-specific phosphotransferase system IIC component